MKSDKPYNLEGPYCQYDDEGNYIVPPWDVGCKHGLGNIWGCCCNCGLLYKTDRAAWVAMNPTERA